MRVQNIDSNFAEQPCQTYGSAYVMWFAKTNRKYGNICWHIAPQQLYYLRTACQIEAETVSIQSSKQRENVSLDAASRNRV